MKAASIKFQRPIGQVLKGKIEAYHFDVGIIKDGPHRAPASKERGLKNFAGGPARRVRGKSNGPISEVSRDVQRNTGIRIYRQPFRRKSDDANRMLKAFFQLVFNENKATRMRRLENLIQAVVRNPILRGTYGKNKSATAKNKGFNRKFIDTAQLFKAIRAKVHWRGK